MLSDKDRIKDVTFMDHADTKDLTFKTNDTTKDLFFNIKGTTKHLTSKDKTTIKDLKYQGHNQDLTFNAKDRTEDQSFKKQNRTKYSILNKKGKNKVTEAVNELLLFYATFREAESLFLWHSDSNSRVRKCRTPDYDSTPALKNVDFHFNSGPKIKLPTPTLGLIL